MISELTTPRNRPLWVALSHNSFTISANCVIMHEFVCASSRMCAVLLIIDTNVHIAFGTQTHSRDFRETLSLSSYDKVIILELYASGETERLFVGVFQRILHTTFVIVIWGERNRVTCWPLFA